MDGLEDGDFDGLGDGLADGDFEGEPLALKDGEFEGEFEGDFDGLLLGLDDGDFDGLIEGLAPVEGLSDGEDEGEFDGETETDELGEFEGETEVEELGEFEIELDGELDGEFEGDLLGELDGDLLGEFDGESDGDDDGLRDGDSGMALLPGWGRGFLPSPGLLQIRLRPGYGVCVVRPFRNERHRNQIHVCGDRIPRTEDHATIDVSLDVGRRRDRNNMLRSCREQGVRDGRCCQGFHPGRAIGCGSSRRSRKRRCVRRAGGRHPNGEH